MMGEIPHVRQDPMGHLSPRGLLVVRSAQDWPDAFGVGTSSILLLRERKNLKSYARAAGVGGWDRKSPHPPRPDEALGVKTAVGILGALGSLRLLGISAAVFLG